ncbi:MAG TPA: dimethyl sulfoxide reductase anchor subunit, partial [Candidatus Mailhella excrementigallinarum]|nr:dimethyl sulfoxide reductase anchor subunit [Candidatus Mailhella excrementigallinarum]
VSVHAPAQSRNPLHPAADAASNQGAVMTAEWPLIAFTVLSQLAAGLAVFLALPGRPASRTGWLSVFVVGAAGLLASLFHLGQPLRAASALNGLGTSWLSAEGLLFGVFTALAGITWLRGGTGISAVGAAVVGILGLAAQGMTYAPESMPFVSGGLPLFIFFLSALTLGAVFRPLSGAEGETRSFGGILPICLWMLLAVLVIAPLTGLAAGTVMRASALAWLHSAWYWTGLLAIAATLVLVQADRMRPAQKALALISVLCIRVAFFADTAHTAVWIGFPY